jgi:hypothetical protein
MIGVNERRFDPLPREISLEDLGPEDNFYRRLEGSVELAEVHDVLVGPEHAVAMVKERAVRGEPRKSRKRKPRMGFP